MCVRILAIEYNKESKWLGGDIVLQTINAEEFLMESQNNAGNLTQTEQQSNQNQPNNTTGSAYMGSSFACMLVLILFIIWALYRVGCLGNKR